MSVCYVALAILVLFHSNFKSLFKQAFQYKFVVASVIFYLVFVLACLWSEGTFKESWQMLTKIHGYILAPLLLIAFQTSKSGKLLLNGFLIGAVLSAVLSIISYLANHHILYGIRDNTWVVFHGHILHNAFLAVAGNFLILLVLDKSYTKNHRVLFLIAYLICLIDTMFVVMGRTGQVMFLAMAAFAMIYHFRIKGIMALIGLGVIIAPLLYLSPAVKQGIVNYKSDQSKFNAGDVETSMGLRWVFHHVSWELFKERPIIGHGTGSFTPIYKDYVIKNNIQGKLTTNPHRDVLWIGVETGVLGVIAFALMIFCAILELLKLPTFCRGAALSLVFGYLLASAQNSFFIDNVTGMAFVFLMLGLIVVGNQKSVIGSKNK